MALIISDNAWNDLLSGIFAVSALIGFGALLMLLLGKMANRFPFTRLSLALALSPLCLIRLLQVDDTSIINLYAMIVILVGITIDGIRHLLVAKTPAVPVERKTLAKVIEEKKKPGLVVWEKAE